MLKDKVDIEGLKSQFDRQDLALKNVDQNVVACGWFGSPGIQGGYKKTLIERCT